MTKITVNFTAHHNPYHRALAENLEEGLSPNFSDDKPHALFCSIPEGRHPRMVDFSAWRHLGYGSHRTSSISGEEESICSALSVAAFQIGDGGGFLGAMPRDSLEWPVYYFLNHAAICFESSIATNTPRAAEWLQTLPEHVSVFLTGDRSHHAALQAHQQLENLFKNIFRPMSGDDIEYIFTPE